MRERMLELLRPFLTHEHDKDPNGGHYAMLWGPGDPYTLSGVGASYGVAAWLCSVRPNH